LKEKSSIEKKQFLNLGRLNQLEFTVLDILNDIVIFKPLFLVLKSTRLVKNYKVYSILKEDLLEKLQIQKIVKLMY